MVSSWGCYEKIPWTEKTKAPEYMCLESLFLLIDGPVDVLLCLPGQKGENSVRAVYKGTSPISEESALMTLSVLLRPLDHVPT